MISERLWMVLTTGGAIKFRLFARAALISAALLFRQWNQTGVQAKSRQNRDPRETRALPTALSALTVRRSWSLLDLTARLGYKPRLSSDLAQEFAMRIPASRQNR